MVVHGMPKVNVYVCEALMCFEDPNRTHCSLVMLVAGASVLGKYATQRRVPALVLLHRRRLLGHGRPHKEKECTHVECRGV